jgi:two-component system, OmpR family, osmolarity sensor histidine kinase EnvZ
MSVFKWRPFMSLRSRLILLIVLTILLAQALTAYALLTYQRQEVQAAAVNLLVTSITTLKAAVMQLPAKQRAAFVHQSSQGQWRLIPILPPKSVRFYVPEGLEPLAAGERPLRRSLRVLARAVNRALADQSKVAVSAGPQPFMYVSLGSAAGQGPWLRVALDRVDPPVSTPVLLWWLLVLALLVLIALGFSWHITRPMTRLVKATDQLARGRPEPVIPSGPSETRKLAEHFNAMLASLEQTQQTQKTLLAGIPHDLKAPMARMALRIEMAQDPELKAGLQRDLYEMQRMTQQFLDFLRGQDASRLQLEVFQLDQWLAQSVAQWQALGKPVELLKPLTVISIRADQWALARLLDNLIDNALMHGAPPVQIGLTLGPPGFVQLTVGDHGPGLSVQQYDQAFKPFARLDPARSRSGSVGLGLSLVKGIAIAHGGSVALDAHHSGGLEVRVRLPIA